MQMLRMCRKGWDSELLQRDKGRVVMVQGGSRGNPLRVKSGAEYIRKTIWLELLKIAEGLKLARHRTVADGRTA